jgi:2'-5' RNA ligase
MRLFVALDLPVEVRKHAASICLDVPGARWTKPEHLHFTLRFIGELPGEAVPALKDSLSKVSLRRFEGRLAGTGRFPRRGLPRILWAGFWPEQPLTDLQRAIEAAVRRAGAIPEERPFWPHLTLARLRDTTAEAAEAFLGKWKDFVSAEFPVESFVLYSSTLTPGGPIYRPEETVRLGG